MSLPLRDLRVVELASSLAAAYTGKILAEMGADVLLVEPPSGAPSRRAVPFNGTTFDAERNPIHLYVDAGKASAVVDLAGLDGAQRVAEMANTADVVLHGFDRGEAARLGLLPADPPPWPGTIVTALTPFGLSGPWADAPWSELTISAASGYMHLCGEPGMEPLGHFAREALYAGGSVAVVATLAALVARDRDGMGAYVDVSLLEANQACMDAVVVGRYGFLGTVWGRAGNSMRYCDALRCEDGLVYPVFVAESAWEGFVLAMGRPDLLTDPRFTTWESREAHFDAFDAIAQEWASGKSVAEALGELQELRVPSAATAGVAQLLADPQAEARGFWQTVHHPLAGVLRYAGAPFLSTGIETRHGRAPLLGEHQHQLAQAQATRPSPLGHRTAPIQRSPRALPLAGTRIIDLTQVWAGPYTTEILADLGADVIHIESPGRPDMTRWWGAEQGLPVPFYEKSSYFRQHNRGKRSLILDLSHEGAREVVRRLVRKSDILLNNFSRRVMDGWGFGYEAIRALNPRIIWGTMPSYGATGPHADYISYGDALQAACGIVAHRGYAPGAPVRVTCSMPDPYASFTMASLLLAALRERDATGTSTSIDLSQRDNAARFVGDELLAYQLTGDEPGAWSNAHPVFAPHRAYRCAGDDRWVAIAVTSDEQWQALCRVMCSADLAADAALATAEGRRLHRDRIDGAISAWTARRDARFVETHLLRAGVPASVVNTAPDLVEHPHLNARGFFPWVEDPIAYTARFPATPFVIQGLPNRAARRAPLFGEHTHAILTEILGMSADEIEGLEASGAVGGVPVLSEGVMWE